MIIVNKNGFNAMIKNKVRCDKNGCVLFYTFGRKNRQ